MNSRMPQKSHIYEKRSARESNSIPHSNLRFESPSGYRWLPSTVPSGSAVALGGGGTGVSVGGGSEGKGTSVGTSVSVGGAVMVGVSEGAAGSVGASVAVPIVDVATGDSITVGCIVLVAVGVRLGGGVSTGEDWSKPEIAAESVFHSSATSTSEASTRGLSLNSPRISCRITRSNSRLFMS